MRGTKSVLSIIIVGGLLFAFYALVEWIRDKRGDTVDGQMRSDAMDRLNSLPIFGLPKEPVRYPVTLNPDLDLAAHTVGLLAGEPQPVSNQVVPAVSGVSFVPKAISYVGGLPVSKISYL